MKLVVTVIICIHGNSGSLVPRCYVRKAGLRVGREHLNRKVHLFRASPTV